jgi:hypothetical protein
MEFKPVVVLGDVVVHVEPAQVVEEVSPVVEEEVSQVVDAPVVDAPVVEDAVVEAAVVEDAVVEDEVVEDAVVEDEVVEAPVVQEAPVVEVPVVEEEEVILLTEEKERTIEPEQVNPPEVTPSALEIARQMFIRKQQYIIQQQNSLRHRMRSLFSFR